MLAMRQGKQDLNQCGAKLAPVTTSMPQRLQYLSEGVKTLPQADAKRVGEEVVAYNTSFQKFVGAINTLSSNKQLQSHLHKEILKLIEMISPPQPKIKK
jgi:hypothetical protein